MTTRTPIKAPACIICRSPLSIRPATGRKSGKSFIFMVCPRDGRHFRAPSIRSPKLPGLASISPWISAVRPNSAPMLNGLKMPPGSMIQHILRVSITRLIQPAESAFMRQSARIGRDCPMTRYNPVMRACAPKFRPRMKRPRSSSYGSPSAVMMYPRPGNLTR